MAISESCLWNMRCPFVGGNAKDNPLPGYAVCQLTDSSIRRGERSALWRGWRYMHLDLKSAHVGLYHSPHNVLHAILSDLTHVASGCNKVTAAQEMFAALGITEQGDPLSVRTGEFWTVISKDLQEQGKGQTDYMLTPSREEFVQVLERTYCNRNNPFGPSAARVPSAVRLYEN